MAAIDTKHNKPPSSLALSSLLTSLPSSSAQASDNDDANDVVNVNYRCESEQEEFCINLDKEIEK